MTKVEPATGWTWDYEIAIIEQELEKGGALFGPLTVRRLVGRIRQEQTAKDVAQRRAEAAERVVEAARVLIEDDVEIMGRRRPCKTHGITSHVVGEACSICDAYAAYDAAKAAGFPEEG